MTQFIPLRQRTLAQLATELPAASRLFRTHRLDFCCGGQITLDAVCRERGLDVEEIERCLVESSAAPTNSLAELSSGELIDIIMNRYHIPARVELEQLLAMSRRVEHRHGDKVHCPRGLAQLLGKFTIEFLSHLDEEEKLLFPNIVKGAASESSLVNDLRAEHAHYGRWLVEVRALTSDYQPPEEACTTWRALYLRLATLEADLLEHVHLENNLLFPRLLADRVAS